MADRSFLGWPFFENSHRALAEELDAWALRELPRLRASAEHDLERGCRAIVMELGTAGFLRWSVPGVGGGAATTLDVRALCIARETLARHFGLADFAFAMQGLGSGPISLFGTREQKGTYLEAVAAGNAIAAFALSEAQAGSDVAAIATIAEPDGDDFLISGEKTWISNAGIADNYVVFARTGEAAGSKGLTAFIVPATSAGLTIPERIATLSPHPLGTVRLERVRVPADHVIGKPGEGFKIAMATLDIFRSTVGAAALGFARRALDEAVAFAHQRRMFDQALASFQLTQSRIADMATDIDTSALLVYRAAWAKDRGAARVTRESGMAKMFATEAAGRVVDSAVQLHGARGIVTGSITEELYREVRALRIYEGTTEIQKLVIARQTLGDARA